MSTQTDPFRDDAALVYVHLRDVGDASAVEIAAAVFPAVEGPESTVKAIAKRGIRRVYDSIVWMRHHGVVIAALPSTEGNSVFTLHPPERIVPAPIVPRETPVPVGVPVRQPVLPVTPKVTHDQTTLSDAMDIWHGGS